MADTTDDEDAVGWKLTRRELIGGFVTTATLAWAAAQVSPDDWRKPTSAVLVLLLGIVVGIAHAVRGRRVLERLLWVSAGLMFLVSFGLTVSPKTTEAADGSASAESTSGTDLTLDPAPTTVSSTSPTMSGEAGSTGEPAHDPSRTEREPDVEVVSGKSVDVFDGDLLVSVQDVYSTWGDLTASTNTVTCEPWGASHVGRRIYVQDDATDRWYRLTVTAIDPDRSMTLRPERGPLPAPDDRDC